MTMRGPDTETVTLGPEALSLLSDLLLSTPVAPRVLNAILEARGLDPKKKWRLGLTAGVLLAEEPGAASQQAQIAVPST